MTRPILTYTIAPSLPKEIERLRELAFNLLWIWEPEILATFMRLDTDLWEQTQHNPTKMLGMMKQERLNALARDDAFLAQLDRAWGLYQAYLDVSRGWCRKNLPDMGENAVAYFSMEFGLSECLPNYSGGLGILSGDHLKSASDLAVPLVGVGLLYQQGYFRQYLNADGWQQERYPENDFFTLPLQQERDAANNVVKVKVELPGRSVTAQIWKVNVGRIRLFLLDTNIPENSKEDQDITDQLYGGDREMRIKQEILLGIGGYRALRALGISPSVCHLNEGHSAFLTLERCLDIMKQHHVSFTEAREAATMGTVFTTHTPVPAGNDYFAPELMEKYFAPMMQTLGLARREFLGLGRMNPADDAEHFCMTVLALRMSAWSNGVSKLHGLISRKMWSPVWPGIPTDDLSIKSITNGIHGPSWVSRDMVGLFDRYVGPRWRENPGDAALWSRVNTIPDEELWRTHERRRERLVAFARNRLRDQLAARGAPPSDMDQASEVLNANALTIGFARRFATYKRARLLFRDPDRLKKILTDKSHPVQIIFAGKAHPQDNPGKDLIREIIHFERDPDIRRKMVFIEDYDMVVARYLVQGVDIWLNTPRRPLEASGTSGMKAAFNGAINLSVLDGWWAEAYTADAGWAIGRGEVYSDEQYQDQVESNALYDLLERDVVPLFYERGSDDLPRGWIGRMKNSMRSLCPQFNTNRMVREYTERAYLPAQDRFQRLTADKLTLAKDLAQWRERIRKNWGDVKIVEVKSDIEKDLRVGVGLDVRAWVKLGRLGPKDLAVDLYQGVLDAEGEITMPSVFAMHPTGEVRGDMHEFSGSIPSQTSGRHGFTIRVLPKHPELDDLNRQGLIHWASPENHPT